MIAQAVTRLPFFFSAPGLGSFQVLLRWAWGFWALVLALALGRFS